MSPAWMPCFASTASYMPSGRPNQRQCVATASMRERTRSSRAAVAITEALPPCELASTSLRRPARCTLSPISTSTRSSVSADSVSVPGDSRCSFDLPIGWIGSTSTLQRRRAIAGAAGQHAVGDGGVGHHRQMRAVLLGRRDRQNGDGVVGVEPFEILRGQLGPENACPGTASLRCRILQANAMPPRQARGGRFRACGIALRSSSTTRLGKVSRPPRARTISLSEIGWLSSSCSGRCRISPACTSSRDVDRIEEGDGLAAARDLLHELDRVGLDGRMQRNVGVGEGEIDRRPDGHRMVGDRQRELGAVGEPQRSPLGERMFRRHHRAESRSWLATMRMPALGSGL